MLDRIRADSHDEFDNPLRAMVDETGGSPMRCCLRASMPGDLINVNGYRPFTSPGPYAETGPVLIDAQPCGGYTDAAAYPAGYRTWPTIILRPNCHDGVIAYDAIQLGDGGTAEELVTEMFTDSDIEFIHTRNLHAGCWMFTITRTGAR